MPNYNDFLPSIELKKIGDYKIKLQISINGIKKRFPHLSKFTYREDQAIYELKNLGLNFDYLGYIENNDTKFLILEQSKYNRELILKWEELCQK
jgi:hypothetical protein